MMDDAFGQDFIDEVDSIIKDIHKLRSTRDTTLMAQKLINLIIQQRQKSQSSQQSVQKSGQSQGKNQGANQNQGNAGGNTSGNPSGNNLSNSSGNTPNNSPSNSGQSNGQSDGKGASQQQLDSDQPSGAGGNGASSGGGKRPSPEEIDEMLKSKTGYGDLSALIQSELNNMALSLPDSIKAGIPTLPLIGRLKAVHGKLDEVAAISASSRMRARLMGMLQSIKRQPQSYGLSGRKLASGRLTRLVLGDPRIFRKKIDTKMVNTAVVVMLDLSGSMSSKYQVANAAAFALHTTLFGLKGVSVCSLEFSGKERQPEVNVLVDFGRNPQSDSFNHRPFDGTPTHKALWAGRALLLQRPEPRKIMLILTDGCPDNDLETKAATQKVIKDGIEIAALGIMDKNVQRFWVNHKIINSIQELPAAMFGIMEGLMTKRIKP
jgi:cobalamin biosynthesis protein CobT